MLAEADITHGGSPMPDIITIEIWLAVNEDGNFHLCTDSASDALNELVSEYSSEAARVIKLTVNVPRPTVPDVKVAVPEIAGEPAVAIEA